MTAFNPHAARSRWFGGPPLADVTPRERALLDELAGAIAWAEGLVQVGWLCGYSADPGVHTECDDPDREPVYVVREALS